MWCPGHSWYYRQPYRLIGRVIAQEKFCSFCGESEVITKRIVI